jgi:hypothetical protein
MTANQLQHDYSTMLQFVGLFDRGAPKVDLT